MSRDEGGTTVTRSAEPPEPDRSRGSGAAETPEPGTARRSRPPRRRPTTGRRRALVLAGQSAVVGAVAAVVAALVVGWDPRLWRTYFWYEGDTFFNAINGVEAGPLGLTSTSTHLGWPYGMNLIDFPAGEPLFTGLQWFFGLFTRDQFTVLSVLWFLGFVLVGAVTHLVLRGLGLGLWPAAVAALAYDFVPYHLWRAFGHTNLALYMAVPMGLLVLLWYMSGRLDRPRRGDPARRPLWRTPDWWVVGVTALVVGLSARYYAVFFFLLLAIVAAGRLLVVRRWSVLWGAVLAGGATLAVALFTAVPQAVQLLTVGGNAEVASRPRTDSDLYALRLTDLLAPLPDHRLEALRDLSASFRNTLQRGEDSSSLGWFLVAGLLFLVVVAVSRWSPWRTEGRPASWPVGLATNAAILAGLSFLIGTVGGLGGVIASLGYTQIRSWNRISIEISFCAALGLGMALAWLWQLRGRSGWRRVVPVVVTPVVLVACILDQTGTTYPQQSTTAVSVASDRTFFGGMADQLGDGGTVFQLPYVAFPESGGLALDYAGFRGYLNDGRRLNYSYGGMRGRESDWQRTWVTMDPDVMLVGLAAAKFDAVLVDRVGYTADTSIEPRLTALLGPARASSPDGRFAWYDLRPVRQRLVATRGADWVTAVGDRVVRPIGIQVRGATYRNNGSGVEDWGALAADSTMQLRRYDDDTAPVDVHFQVKAAAGSHVALSGDAWQETLTSTGDPVDIRHQVSMDPKVAGVRIVLDAPNTASITDPRPDVRGELFDVQVLDSALAQQIAQGQLRMPPG